MHQEKFLPFESFSQRTQSMASISTSWTSSQENTSTSRYYHSNLCLAAFVLAEDTGWHPTACTMESKTQDAISWQNRWLQARNALWEAFACAWHERLGLCRSCITISMACFSSRAKASTGLLTAGETYPPPISKPLLSSHQAFTVSKSIGGT